MPSTAFSMCMRQALSIAEGNQSTSVYLKLVPLASVTER